MIPRVEFPLADGVGEPVEPVEIAFVGRCPELPDLDAAQRYYAGLANVFGSLLVHHAPGGLVDAILVELLDRHRSVLRVPLSSLPQGIVSAYELVKEGPGRDRVWLERRAQRAGPPRWGIFRAGECLNRFGDWESQPLPSERHKDQPLPSERHKDFLNRCRFCSVEEALKAWERRREG